MADFDIEIHPDLRPSPPYSASTLVCLSADLFLFQHGLRPLRGERTIAARIGLECLDAKRR